MPEDFLVFLDADVLISACIFGRLGKLKDSAEHINYSKSVGLLEKLYRLSQCEAPPDIGHISITAEREARKEISRAVSAVIKTYWKQHPGISDEEKLQYADAIHALDFNSHINLDKYVYMLQREPPNMKQRRKLVMQLRSDFNGLDAQYRSQKSYYSKVMVLPAGLPFSGQNSYVPGIEDTDLEILADAIPMTRKTGKTVYIASLNVRHLASKWAVEMLENNYGIRVRKPDDILRIVTKRYRHP